MGKHREVYGDLFDKFPTDKNVLIPHVVNDVGAFGSGFVVPLGQYFPRAREQYLDYYRLNMLHLGQVGFTTTKLVTVANMCAQTGIMKHSTGDRSKVNNKPIRYEALVQCMRHVVDHIKLHDRHNAMMNMPTYPTEIHAPKFGSDRAGGNWNFIEELIEEIWGDFDVTIYHLN